MVRTTPRTPAQDRWRAELAAWTIEPEILAVAVEDPWVLPVELFRVEAVTAGTDPPPAPTPSRRRALEVLPTGGTVLDVGCGGGRAGLALVPPAGHLVGVDGSAEMLAAFAATCQGLDVPVTTYRGSWPQVADQVPVADLVVSHNVAYNVADLSAFARALSGHSTTRVVLEITARHPIAWMGPLWTAVHGVRRPVGPDADLVAEVLAEAGLDVQVERFTMPGRPRTADEQAVQLQLTRRRLCLPPGAEDEVARLLDEHPAPVDRELACLWWAGTARRSA
ncbi:MAG: class I SAM-dependent methyltransferase [Actinomycetes bacterium]